MHLALDLGETIMMTRGVMIIGVVVIVTATATMMDLTALREEMTGEVILEQEMKRDRRQEVTHFYYQINIIEKKN